MGVGEFWYPTSGRGGIPMTTYSSKSCRMRCRRNLRQPPTPGFSLVRSSPRTEGNCGIARVFSPCIWEQVDVELACRSPCARVALRKSRRSLFPVDARRKSRFSDGEASWVFGNFGLVAHPPAKRILEFPQSATQALSGPVLSRFTGCYHHLAIAALHRPPMELVHRSRVASHQGLRD
jgi:hypothetical protein